jgi:hypothetical protein
LTYRSVPGEGLRTRWDDQPVVLISNRRDAFGMMELSWATQPLMEGWVARRTRVVFDDVVEYRWRYWDVIERSPRRAVDGEWPEDGGLELGEIEDSARVTALVEQGFDRDLRHFRVSFDEHGTYDVICRRIRIEYQPRQRATQADAAGGEDRPAGYYPSVRSCPFDDHGVLLFAVDTVDGRLVLECTACGRVYDAPDDLTRVRPPQPNAAQVPQGRPASYDEIDRGGWTQFLPFDEDGNPRPR